MGDAAAAAPERAPGQTAAEWRAARAVAQLPRSDLLATDFAPALAALGAPAGHVEAVVGDVVWVLREVWCKRWGGERAWRGFLNANSFLKEMEESVWPLAVVAAAVGEADGEYVVADMCGAKGFLAMLLSFLAVRRPALRARIRRVVLAEKQDDICWQHVAAANLDAASGYGNIPIEVWKGCNVHDEGCVERLAAAAAGDGTAPPARLILTGIHLCRRLSSRFVEIVNVLGPAVAAFALAPCCLPCPNTREILVRREGEAGEAARAEAAPVGARCHRCGAAGHVRKDCTADKALLAAQRAAEKARTHHVLDWAGAARPAEPAAGAAGPPQKKRRRNVDDGALFARWVAFLRDAAPAPCHEIALNLKGAHGGGADTARRTTFLFSVTPAVPMP